MNDSISGARQLSAESIADPKAFKSKIENAIKKSKGNVSEAAKLLGVSRRTMCRYISEHQFGGVVGEMRGKNDTDERKYNRRMQRKSRARRSNGKG